MKWSEQLGTEKQGLRIVTSIDGLRGLDELSTPNAVEVAWRRMELDGVVVLGRSAAVYVKQVTHYDAQAEHELHGQLWLHGTAPLLLVVDSSQFRIYSARPKKPGSSPTGKAGCIEALDRAKQALEIAHFLEHVQLGDYFEKHREHFLPSNSIDAHFRRALEATRDALREVDLRVSLAKIHELLVRSLLLRYLSDRRVLSRAFFKRHLGVKVDSLFDYFRRRESARESLAAVFAGIHSALGFLELEGAISLVQDEALREEHFELVVRLLSGEEVETGQLALGDWVYDLSLLPVELLSTVYQEFVSAEVEEAKKRIGLVATPRFLAEAVLDVAFDGLSSTRPRVLDPACGSGIFLVGCFNRLAHRLLRDMGQSLSASKMLVALVTLSREQLVGVELKATACELARLNILHAILNQFSDEQLAGLLRGRAPTEAWGRPATRVQAGNFFERYRAVREHSFDLVVGNPPWSKDKAAMASWIEGKATAVGIPDRSNLVYGFAWRVTEFLRENGRCCLLLDAKAMLSARPAGKFAELWFRRHQVDEIVNLTSMRAQLFQGNAGRAACIFKFRKEEPHPRHTIEYIAPSPNNAVKRGGLLDLSQSRRQRISYLEVLAAARRKSLPQLWRVRLHGTNRDANLIERLQRFPPLKALLEQKGWGMNQGFNRHGGHNVPLKRSMLDEIPHLPTKDTGLWAYRFPSHALTRAYGSEENEKDRLVQDWPSNAARLFHGERVIIHQTPLKNPPMLRSAHVSRSFTFHKEQRAIFAPKGQTKLLKFISATLSSSLAFYYFFHTSVSWGVDAQPQIRTGDLDNFPLPIFSDGRPAQILNEVAELVDDVSPQAALGPYRDRVIGARERINRLVLEYFECDEWEEDLVNDCEQHLSTLVYGTPPAEWEISAKRRDCRDYVERLALALNQWSPRGSVNGKAFVSSEAGLGVVVLERDSKAEAPCAEVLDNDERLAELLAQVHHLLQASGSPRSARDVMVFQGNCLFITKPLHRRYWTRTAALNDADSIAAALLSTRSVPQ